MTLSPVALTSSELAAQLGEQRNRVFRLLRTLEEAGYVFQDPETRAFRPTLKLISLGNSISQTQDLEAVALPIMERLQQATGETVYLVARDGDRAVCLLTLESSHMMRISARPGHSWGLGLGAAGQSLLLSLPARELADFLQRFPDMTARHRVALDRFSCDGVTFVDGCDGMTDEGVMAIASPVKNRSDGPLLALAVAWPNNRSTADVDIFRPLLLQVVQDLEEALSVHPYGSDQIRGSLGEEAAGS